MTAARLLTRVLRAAGIDALYGHPRSGLHVIEVRTQRVADLLAVAHTRIHGRAAATLDDHGVLRVGGQTGGIHEIGSPDDLVALTDVLAEAQSGRGGVAVRLDLEMDAPAPDVWPDHRPPTNRYLPVADEVVAQVRAADAPVVLAGPGVVRDRAVPGLHAIAAAGSLGVLNTWGAKGVFDWRSRHHLATAGLQANDFALGGLADADLIVATGVDPAEAPPDRWAFAPVVDVPPGSLDPLAERWGRPHAAIAVPALMTELARVTQEGWAQTRGPLAPSRATRAYSVLLGDVGQVFADPGLAGYWVARTFATTTPDSAHVTADATAHGFAAACAVVARLRDAARPVLAVVDGTAGRDGGPAEIVAEVIEAGSRLGIAVPLEVWAPDGASLGPDAHDARLRDLIDADRSATATLATDPTQLGRMLEVAGEVVAWGGLGDPAAGVRRPQAR